MEKSTKVLVIAGLVTILAIGGGAATQKVLDKNSNQQGHGSMSMSSDSSQTDYKLDLKSGTSYLPGQPVALELTIADKSGNQVKNFDVVHEKRLHLIVVRKDRSNFQHVHPELAPGSGGFKLASFNFGASGQYRVFADFTPSNATPDDSGAKQPVTPYQDVQVGDIAKYTPEPIGSDKTSSSSNGFDTNLASANYYAHQTNTVKVAINQNAQPFKNLQTYLGALGHMVVLGPKLEFIHAHAQTTETVNQSGVITFAVDLLDAGQYKLYLQTQAGEAVNTTDYTISATQDQNATQPTNNDVMQDMKH